VDLREIDQKVGLDETGLGQGRMAGSCEHGNEPSGAIKGEKFRGQHSDYHLLQKDYTLWRWLVGWLLA
jgi:hypothetical protein